MRRRPRTLREILIEALAVSPVALAALGGGCGQGGLCGTHVVVVEVTPSVYPDGGIDCSPCQSLAVNCNPVSIDGKVELACNDFNPCAGGRRPAALLASRWRRKGAETPGAFFSKAARLEAASVIAFQSLAGELTAHRAPAQLVAWCRRSALEEVRHARMTAALARRYGAEPEKPEYAAAIDIRALETIARENAFEGCARESFGAAMAAWQSAHARDPVVAQNMARIACDEVRHAELAWSIAEWSASKMTPAGRRRTREARELAASELADEIGQRTRSAVRDAGLPSVEQQSELALRFAAALGA